MQRDEFTLSGVERHGNPGGMQSLCMPSMHSTFYILRSSTRVMSYLSPSGQPPELVPELSLLYLPQATHIRAGRRNGVNVQD
jgi:hypothetical protein